MIRYVYCKKGYDVENKVHVLKEDLKEVSEERKNKTLKTDIRIMLEILQDAELQVDLTKNCKDKSHGVEYLRILFGQPHNKRFQVYFQLGASSVYNLNFT